MTEKAEDSLCQIPKQRVVDLRDSARSEFVQHSEQSQEKRQQSQISAPLDVVLDAEVNGLRRLDDLTTKKIQVGMVGRVAEYIRHKKRQHAPDRVRPTTDLAQTSPPFAKAVLDELG